MSGNNQRLCMDRMQEELGKCHALSVSSTWAVGMSFYHTSLFNSACVSKSLSADSFDTRTSLDVNSNFAQNVALLRICPRTMLLCPSWHFVASLAYLAISLHSTLWKFCCRQSCLLCVCMINCFPQSIISWYEILTTKQRNDLRKMVCSELWRSMFLWSKVFSLHAHR